MKPKDRALSALVSSTSIRQAAQIAGVSERSIYTWLRTDSEFQAAYRDIRADSLQTIADAISEKSIEAVEVLSTVMMDENASAGTRIRAAQTILETNLRLMEILDFEQRLTAVEEKLR